MLSGFTPPNGQAALRARHREHCMMGLFMKPLALRSKCDWTQRTIHGRTF